MVDGVGLELREIDAAETDEGTVRIWVIATGNAEVHGCLTGNGHTTRSLKGVAVIRPNRLAGLIWVLGKRQWDNLIEVDASTQVGALTAHVSDTRDKVLRQLVLHVQVPLLNVRPTCLGGNCVKAQWKRQDSSTAAAADVVIPDDIRLRRIQDKWRRCLERFDVLLVAIPMFEKDAIPTSDRPFSIAPRIPGEAEAWAGVEQVPLHASRRLTSTSALHDAVEDAGISKLQLSARRGIHERAVRCDRRGVRTLVHGGLEIEGLVIFLAVGSEEAETQTEV